MKIESSFIFYGLVISISITRFASYAQELGPPPQLVNLEHETSIVAPASETVPPIDTLNRFAVVAAYHNEYLASEGVPLGWDGNAANCTLGGNSLAHQQATIRRVNFVRALAGLSGMVVLDSDENSDTDRSDKCIEAAMMMSAENALSHSPSASWMCYSAGGAEAAGKSNLALGTEGPAAIDLYMDDPGGGNYFVGHRRWLLFPRQVRMGTGSVPGANALWVLADFGSRPAGPEFIAWPSPGYFPHTLLPRQSKRWSVSIPGANFESATVVVTSDSQRLSVSLEDTLNDSGFADNTLVWTVDGVVTTAPAEDISYQVTISGINGAPQASYEYEVIVMDPYRYRPNVEIRSDESELTVSWPGWVDGFKLEQGVPLGDAFGWSDVTDNPVQVDEEQRVTFPRNPAPGLEVFRLRKD